MSSPPLGWVTLRMLWLLFCAPHLWHIVHPSPNCASLNLHCGCCHPSLCRPAVSDQEEQLLLEALLADSGGGGEDVEQGGGGGKKRQHSWFALVGIAAKYMWPDSLPLQVRRGAGGGGGSA